MSQPQQNNNSFKSLVKSKQNELWGVKANYLTEKEEVYFQRALFHIYQDKNLLALSKTQNGALSIILCIGKAIQMGLQIGGQIPQAYIVAYQDTATLIPTADGYKFIALSEPNPVLKSFVVRAIYEGEKFSLNYATGEVKHEIDYKTQRGALMGCYCMITELNGTKLAEYISREDIEQIRNTHSISWRAFQAGKIKVCPWNDDFVMMALKTATKRFLKPYAALKEGLAMALQFKDDTEEEKYDNRPIQDRASSILDDAIEADATVDMTAEAKKPEKKPKEEKPKESEKWEPKDLF